MSSRSPGQPLQWALLVPLPAKDLEAHATARMYTPEDEQPSWYVVQGSREYSALIETEPGSAGTEHKVAMTLAQVLGKTIFALGLIGYDDPHDGLPYIERYDTEEKGLIWIADFDTEELDDTEGLPVSMAQGPNGVPCDDPFVFAEALGCPLPPYRG